MEWAKQQYNSYYESYVPWIEDKYLAWFGENKASYVAKDKLAQTKVTGNEDVDKAQDGVNNAAAGQLGKGGLGEAAGKLVSDEGMTRSERSGKGSDGNFIPGTK